MMGDLQRTNCVTIINEIITAIFSCFEVSNTPRTSRTVRGGNEVASPGGKSNVNNKPVRLPAQGETVVPPLPDEMIIEILSCLPVKCLMRFKCVCKLWHATIQDQKFIDKHMRRGKGETVYVDTNTDGFRWVYSVDGLLVETNDNVSKDKYRIRNPGTKQVVALPDPEARLRATALCLVPSTGDYKLVFVHYNNGTTDDLGVKVLTVGTDVAWRPLNGISLSYNSNAEDTFVCGGNNGLVVYIVKMGKAESGRTTEIIGLMMEDEGFMKISIPQGFHQSPNRNRNNKAFTWVDKLSLGFVIQEELHVWVLEDYKEQKWSEKRVIPLTFMEHYPNLRKEVCFRNSISHAELLVSLDSMHNLSYDIKSMKVGSTTNRQALYSTLAFLPGMRLQEQIE